jgi:hypothetical protein
MLQVGEFYRIQQQLWSSLLHAEAAQQDATSIGTWDS